MKAKKITYTVIVGGHWTWDKDGVGKRNYTNESREGFTIDKNKVFAIHRHKVGNQYHWQIDHVSTGARLALFERKYKAITAIEQILEDKKLYGKLKMIKLNPNQPHGIDGIIYENGLGREDIIKLRKIFDGIDGIG